jgi:endonuclease YncB( thermonuclease family)
VTVQSKIRRKTVELRPSRIRRDPIRLEGNERRTAARSPEQEIWGGVAGVLAIAVLLVVVIVGLGAATIFRDDPDAAAREERFAQCYNAEGSNCVLDGGTIYWAGDKVRIAGMDAPQILGAQCRLERERGIDAAVKLVALLNGGKVTVGPEFRDESGREVHKVMVDGNDVAKTMISAGSARKPSETEAPNWCAEPKAESD